MNGPSSPTRQPAGTADSTEAPARERRVWPMKLALALVAPLLFFAALELGLRLADVGRNPSFFIPDETPGFHRTNPRYTELFFPASFGLKPLNFRLTKEKPAGTLRVFVIGESAAMGVPEPGFSLAPQLRALLRGAHPGREIEVHNLGVTAINSHAIRHLAAQAIRFQPDLLVVYMGNNEVVGPFGPGSAVGEQMLPLPLIRISLWVRATRTGQLLQRLLATAGGARRQFKDWRGMEMFAGRSVRADDPRLEKVYAAFSANLSDIVEMAEAAGIKTVLSTVAVNVRDCGPFVSEHVHGMPQADLAGWRSTFEQALVSAELGDTARAREAFTRALELDAGFAETHFAFARFLESQGESEQARARYLDALRLDALRFRADGRINEIIRRAAAQHPRSILLVDAARELGSDAASTAPPAGHGFFFEHVHLNWDGNYALARALAPAAAEALLGTRPQSDAWLSSEECAAAVGFTEIGRLTMLAAMDELTARPPFIAQRTFAEDRVWLRRQIADANAALSSPEAVAAAAALVERARAADPTNPFLVFHAASVALQAGDTQRALELNERLASLQPASPEQAAQKAYLLQQLGRIHEAEEVLLASAEDEPYYFQTYALLAQLWIGSGQVAKARQYFAELAARMPGSRAALHSHAQALASAGDMAGAEREWRKVLQITPDDEAALAPLVGGLLRRGEVQLAMDVMLAAHRYNPRSLPNNARLVELFAERGDLANLITFMRALADSGAAAAALHYDLALHLAQLGRSMESRLELLRARKAAAAERDETLLREIDARLASP